LPAPPETSPYAAGVEVVAHADGASRGNPGPASYGCVYLGEDGEPAWGEGQAIGVATNNVAEYRGCLAALQRLAGWGVKRAILRLDSQLVVRQLNGEYRVKDSTLRGWYTKILEVVASLDVVRFEHVPRAQNADADRMANHALDAVAS
jgi:ribonuclease HI